MSFEYVARSVVARKHHKAMVKFKDYWIWGGMRYFATANQYLNNDGKMDFCQMFNKLFDKVQNIDMKDNIRWLLDYVQYIQEDIDKIKEFNDNMPAWYTLWKHLKDNETELFKTEICNLNLVDCNDVSSQNHCNLQLTPDSDIFDLTSLIHVFWALNLYQTSSYAAQILQFQSFDYRKNPWIMTTQREKLIEYLKIQSG